MQNCIDQGATINILCDEKPDPESTLYKMIANHIETTKAGHITLSRPISRSFLKDITDSNDLPHFFCSNGTNLIADHMGVGDTTLISFGRWSIDTTQDVLDNFATAAYVGTIMVGQKPRVI